MNTITEKPKTLNPLSSEYRDKAFAYSGVTKYLGSKGLKKSEAHHTIRVYAREELNFEVRKSTGSKNFRQTTLRDLVDASFEIGKDFEKFVKWFRKKRNVEIDTAPQG